MATSKANVKPAAKPAPEKEVEKEEAAEATGKQGAAIVLPNGERRVDYIHRRYYDEDIERGAIAKELTEMNGKDAEGKDVKKVPYQIVFAATKGDAAARAAKKAERAAKAK